MTALIGAAGGAVGLEALRGFFNLRTRRQDGDTQMREKLWVRIADLEKAMRDQEKDHRTDLTRMEAEHRQQMSAMQDRHTSQMSALEAKHDTLQIENVQLTAKLQMATVEIAALNARVSQNQAAQQAHNDNAS